MGAGSKSVRLNTSVESGLIYQSDTCDNKQSKIIFVSGISLSNDVLLDWNPGGLFTLLPGGELSNLLMIFFFLFLVLLSIQC